MSLVRKFITVGGATLGSRIMGFVRETMMAAALGTGPMADAFFAAFRLPNLFRRLFAEGAFNAAFVPLFAKEIEEGGKDAAKRFSEEVFGVLFTVLLVITIAMELAMPWIVRFIVAPGFDPASDKFAITVKLAAIMFPYLACMSLTAMLSGMLNSLHHYLAASIAPIFFNIAMIAALAWGLYIDADAVRIATDLSWAVLFAGILQMVVLYVGVRHAGMSIGFRRPRLTPNVKRLLWLALPAAVTGGITQINQIIGQMIASGKEGAISALQYADRIYQLPLGVVGIAVGVVLLPELSRALKGGHMVEAQTLQNRSLEFVLFLTLPAAAAIWVLSDEMIRVVYERGAFTPDMTANVASILAIYALGLPGFVLNKALNPGFFAREDTKTPMRFTGVTVAVNCALALSLFPFFTERGIAAAEAVAGWLYTVLLFVTLIRRGHLEVERALISRAIRLVAAAVLTGAALEFASRYAAPYLAPGDPILEKGSAILALIALAMITYFPLAFVLGGADLGMIRRNMRRKARSEPAPTAPEEL